MGGRDAGICAGRRRLSRPIGTPPPFRAVVAAIDANPQLVRWTAVRAQRNAELLAARLKPIPDVRVTAGWRHYRDTNDNAVRLGLSVPIPVLDQNQGGIVEAQEASPRWRPNERRHAPR